MSLHFRMQNENQPLQMKTMTKPKAITYQFMETDLIAGILISVCPRFQNSLSRGRYFSLA